MSTISFYAQAFVTTAIGYGIAVMVAFKLFLGFIKSPVKFVRKTFFTRRAVMPSCLNDPSLGSHQFIQLKDVKLHYVVSGPEDAPLMLCLHGFPECWYSWRYQIREFSKDYRVVAVDQRGYGDSDKPGGKYNYTRDKLGEDIRQLIEALGYRKCTLLGHDWGGAVSWFFVSMYPQMVEKLVIFNAPHPANFQKYIRTNKSQFKKSWYMYFFQVPFLPELAFQAGDLKMIEKFLHSLPNNHISAEEIEGHKYCFSSKGSLTGPINWYRAAFSQPIKSKTEKCDTPTLVIWGEPDEALNTELAYLAADYMTNIQVKIVKDSCHFVMLDKPTECNKLVRDFLGEKSK